MSLVALFGKLFEHVIVLGRLVNHEDQVNTPNILS